MVKSMRSPGACVWPSPTARSHGSRAAETPCSRRAVVVFITQPLAQRRQMAGAIGRRQFLAALGRNITGITVLNVELIAKSLELIHSLMPPTTTIAVLVNPANIPQAATERSVIHDAPIVLDGTKIELHQSQDRQCARPQDSAATAWSGG